LRRRLARGASEEANHPEAVHDETVPEQPPPVTPHPLDRRTFLRAGAVLAAGAVGVTVAGRWLQARASAVASRAAVVLSGAVAPLPPLPAGTDLGIPGLTPFVTPNASFYRIDTALSVPQVDVDGWRLQIFGMVGRPMELTFVDLQARELVEADVTIACVSNEVGGDLIGNARWMGVRLADVLAEAEVDPRADQIVGRSVDGFTAGFPTAAALDGREALIAIGMNGEPLPLDHGFPARLIVPGLYGYVSATKWLAEIELTTFDAFNGYWIPRGWSKEAPIKTQSRIDVPRGAVSPGRTAVAGVAWAQGRGIERVEVQVDEEPWAEARLAEAAGDDTWRQWVYEWNAEPGSHRLRVRATDRAGDTQGERRVQPIPNGAEGWHTVVVDVTPGP
jgi:DMSO/TMAO reductase YedYZ molybdopterin-dependent catalytic subunit